MHPAVPARRLEQRKEALVDLAGSRAGWLIAGIGDCATARPRSRAPFGRQSCAQLVVMGSGTWARLEDEVQDPGHHEQANNKNDGNNPQKNFHINISI